MFRSASNAPPLVLGLAILFLTACGGSQQSLPSPAIPASGGGTTGAGPSTGAAFARVTLVIKVPHNAKAVASKTLRREPQFVSPSIVSVTVSVTATGSPATSVTSNVVCSTAVPPTCTVTASILAPVQKEDTFTVVAYDGANATGNVLSQGSIVYPVNAGAAEQIPVVLQGTAASIVAVSVANASPVTGTSATSEVSVTAADADGNVIAGQYQTPVTLQLFESDSEGLFSFAPGGAIVATGSVAGSATPATVYLKAKPDTTTPDDVTIVATVAGAPFVPGTSATPAPASIGEIMTVCAATSPQCVFYPSGAQIIANSAIDTWGTPYAFPGTPQDPGGAGSIWNVAADLGTVNQFVTSTGAFANVTTTAPPLDVATDIAGSFWGAGTDPTSTLLGDEQLSISGTLLQSLPLTTAAAQQAGNDIPMVGSTFDSAGQFWSIDGSYIYATNPATGISTACSFASTDANFANASVDAVAVAGNVVWLGVNNTTDGNAYVFKVPVQITASGCNLSTLETAGNKFELTALAGQFNVNQIVVDAAGDAYAFQVSSIWKITLGGQAVKLLDTGTALTQLFEAGTLDPTGAFLYLVDPGTGVLYKASAALPTAGTLPSITLPPVFGIVGANLPVLYYVPFFTSDGTLWLGAAPFGNTALPFNLLDDAESLGGLDEIRLARATFAARLGAASRTREQVLRMLHSPRAFKRSGFHRRALR